MSDLTDRRKAMIWGALVADAATMGFHWLYDQARIAELAPDTPEFRTPRAADYEGVKGYFAHPTKTAGDLSHYGEQARVMLDALAKDGAYSRQSYIDAFSAHFGYGGTFSGYIDRATRDTLNTLGVQADDSKDYPGSQDVQVPALSKLPALVARHHDDPDLATMVEDAVRVTNHNDTSAAYGALAGQLLSHVVTQGTLPDLGAMAATADPDVASAVLGALAKPAQSTQAVTSEIGLSCYLSYCVPSVMHNLATHSNFTDAIRTNIYAAGDNCGRAVLLGSVMGAVHGIGTDTGIPQDWIDRLNDKAQIAELIDKVIT